MSAVGWQHVLDQARSEHEVVKVVREFVASLDYHELARLPAPCRPGKFFDAEDITTFAFEVVRHHCDEAEPTRELVHRIAAFFSHASTRLSQILARSNDLDEETQKSA
jgi:hypothetical protein